MSEAGEYAMEQFRRLACLMGVLPEDKDAQLNKEQLMLLLQAFHAHGMMSAEILTIYGVEPDDERIRNLYERWSEDRRNPLFSGNSFQDAFGIFEALGLFGAVEGENTASR
jgi:hypothetical protein